MQDEKDINMQEPENQEVDLLELAMKLWKSRSFIIKWMIGGIIVGLIIAFSIPKEYTTSITLAPEIKEGKSSSSGLSSLAALAGVNLSGSNTDAINPAIYPDIVGSVPFNVELFDVTVTTSDKEPQNITVREFLEENTRGPWWGFIFSLPGKAINGIKSLFTSEEVVGEGNAVDPFRLTRDESIVVQLLTDRISADVDTKTAIITVNVTMQDPLVSAMLTDTVVERLQDYVTNYRTNKARADLDYSQRLNDEAREEYHKAQQTYANYVDRNQNISLSAGRIEAERLSNEASLAFNVYNQTAQQLQLAKAKVQELAPVYTVIKPATVPLTPTKPKKFMILVGFIFMAFVIAAAWVLYGRDMVAKIRTKKDEDGDNFNNEGIEIKDTIVQNK